MIMSTPGPLLLGSALHGLEKSLFVNGTDLLQDTQNFGLRMRRECRERFPRYRLQRNRGLAIPACITARASLPTRL